jgi:biotin carboxyl carrier protein
MAADRNIDQTSVLSGQVVSQGLVTPGTVVREGNVLVNVQTLAGPMPTARATSDGVVREVLVKAGETIRSGDVVARVEPTHN